MNAPTNINKKKRGSGSELDAGNIGGIAYIWKTLIQENPTLFRAVELDVTDKTREGYQILKEKDAELQRLLRTWVQCTNIISQEIKERVEEMEELSKSMVNAGLHPALQVTDHIVDAAGNSTVEKSVILGPNEQPLDRA